MITQGAFSERDQSDIDSPLQEEIFKDLQLVVATVPGDPSPNWEKCQFWVYVRDNLV